MTDEIDGRGLRDLGTTQVLRLPWKLWARHLIPIAKRHLSSPFTAEQLKHVLRELGLGEPHHPNAWGAFILSLARQKTIVRTGKWTHARDKKSHACTVPFYAWD